jgi:N6-adenosine-specific RNA methylase IME4
MMFPTIMMDPPWLERGAGKSKRGADKHYPLLPTKQMPAVIYGSGVFRPAENAHLYMWATVNFLPDALWLMEALNFRYVTQCVWVKDKVGLGQYFRMQHELLLLGVRGRGPLVRTDDKSIPSVISAPRTRHSKKPEESYVLIERRSHGPYLEMFARSERPGWVSWGNEVGDDNA